MKNIPAVIYIKGREDLEDILNELRQLCAAYQAALEYDNCPEPSEAATLPEDILTDFTEQEFRSGAANNEGRRPDEIADSIIRFVGKLKLKSWE